MRMYTLHFGQGLEHTEALFDQAKSNLPSNFTGFANGAGAVPNVGAGNTQITSHKEIFERYGIKGGHGDYCLEVWTGDQSLPPNLAQLHTGGFGDLSLTGYANDIRPFYIKFDFMYTNTTNGNILVVQRSKNEDLSRDLTIGLRDGFLKVEGSKHIDQPPVGSLPNSWIASIKGKQGTIFLEPNQWHEIQIFINAGQGWNSSDVGHNPPIRNLVFEETFVAAFEAFESHDNSIVSPFNIESAETSALIPSRPLKLDAWPSNGHPIFPNVMLPGQDQSMWPPENQASGQFFYGDELGLVYIWVNGKLDIQQATNITNETNDWLFGFSQQSLYLGHPVNGSNSADPQGNRFFYNNIIMNDSRDPSGSLPSKIFDPLFTSDSSLEWNPGYNLKFTAMKIDPDFWGSDLLGAVNGRRSNAWMPTYPRGAMVPSGEPFFIPSPNRFGSSNDSMIPHGTKLTTIHLDWDGDQQDYTVENGIRATYPDYDVDYAYQHLQPEESNPFRVNADDPHLISVVSGNKSLFYLKRPPSVSGKQPFAGGPGLGGVKDYVPNIDTNLGETVLPVIYRIWTCLQDHTVGTTEPIDEQRHMIRIPSGVSGFVDFISDNQCPGDRGYRAYTNGNASISNGYSMSDWPYNPVTNLPWTWDDLEVLQVGSYHGTHLGSNQIELYTMYLTVEHSSPINTEIGILGTNLLEWAVADEIPYVIQQRNMYKPGWRQNTIGEPRSYFNRWDISPTFIIDRTDRATTDGQAIIDTPKFSGVISFDYKIKYINGEIVPGNNYRQFDEHFPEVWVFTISGISPSFPRRFPFRGEVITDGAGNHFTFLAHPVLQYNSQKFPTDNNLSPLTREPYIVYDEGVMYVIPLTTHKIATVLDPNDIFGNWTDPNTLPATSGSFGAAWKINKAENVFNFKFDPDSFFDTISPSSIANHQLTHPGDAIDTTFPISRDGHDEYFRAPNLASGSALQTIFLTDRLGVPEAAIDNGLYEVHIGLYQTTANQTVNDTGEGKFTFFSGRIGVDTFISEHTFGPDGTAGWHLNDTTIAIPSGTRQVLFQFDAIRNTTGPKSPGGTLGGTSNFASFDEPFFIMSLASGLPSKSIHPADTNQDSRISTDELASYMEMWQNGLLPLGVAKDYLTQAEQIWQSGVSNLDPSGGLYRDSGGPKPENWVGSGIIQ